MVVWLSSQRAEAFALWVVAQCSELRPLPNIAMPLLSANSDVIGTKRA